MLFPNLPVHLKDQLDCLEHHSMFGTLVHMCAARLNSGEFIPRLALFGFPPEANRKDSFEDHMSEISDIAKIVEGAHFARGLNFDIESFRESERRARRELLPNEIATIIPTQENTPSWIYRKIQSFTETGMGYRILAFRTKTDERHICLSHSPEFIELPTGVKFEDIVDVERLGRDTPSFDCYDATKWVCYYVQ